MSLLHLPDELLCYIAENLESERNISVFLRANRKLHSVLNSYLYRYNVEQSGSSALLWVAKHGRLTEAEKLLREGANIQVTNDVFSIALVLSAEEGHKEMVKLLLDNGADVNAQGGGLYGTALQGASTEGHEPIMKLLLDKGADVNAQVEEHGTALQGASAGGHEPIVKLLLDNGADVNAHGGGLYGTALQAAAVEGHEQIVKLLFDNGAYVNG
ncbi:hypothetical protein FOBRF1_013700 [Fusarium oxysporum]